MMEPDQVEYPPTVEIPTDNKEAKSSHQQRIDIYVDWDHSHHDSQQFSHLLKLFSGAAILVRIRFSNLIDSWEALFDFIDSFRHPYKNFIRVDLEGEIHMDESLLYQLFERRLIIRYPIYLPSPDPLKKSSLDQIIRIAQFGLPVIFDLYLSDGYDPSTIGDFIAELMTINYCAGFSLYPIDHALRAKQENSVPSIPQWVGTLVDIYKRFPYYDTVFEPLIELADISSAGGLHEHFGIPRYMRLSVCNDGTINIFRQNPNKAVPWDNWSGLVAKTQEELLEYFVQQVKSHYGIENHLNSSCQFCETCCGTDEPCNAETPLTLKCETRSFFIEAFQSQKQSLSELNNESKDNL